MKTTIFTDGSSRGNPGPGGWGAIIIYAKEVLEIGGREELTTNNRMELTACIRALSYVAKGADIVLYSDSKYVINGITLWVFGWQRNNGKNSRKKLVLNRDLWEKLIMSVKEKNIVWKYVPGHSTNIGNNRCDEIATSLADNKTINFFKGNLEDYPFGDIKGDVII